jgi:hypothetical protein
MEEARGLLAAAHDGEVDPLQEAVGREEGGKELLVERKCTQELRHSQSDSFVESSQVKSSQVKSKPHR